MSRGSRPEGSSRSLPTKSPLMVLPLLLVVIAVVYSPTVTARFNADDYSFLRLAFFNVRQILEGQFWNEWFIGTVTNYAVFRPMWALYWLLNYLAFGLDPLGYHLATAALHLVASFAAFLLASLLTRNRALAAVAAVLFAIMPVHAEAVSWLAAVCDVLSGLYFFAGLIFYIRYRRAFAWRWYLMGLGAFMLAVGSKETSVTLPGMLLLYDLLFHPRDWLHLRSALRMLLGYVPFGMVLAVRFMQFGHGFRGALVFAPEGWWYYIDLNLLRVFDPLPELLPEMRWLALGMALLFLALCRFRPVALYALAWIPITLLPTAVGGVSDRSFYIPSFAIALLLAAGIHSLWADKRGALRAAGVAGLVVLLAAYGSALFVRNQAFARASQVAQAIVDQVAQLHPDVPPDARMVFVGVPNSVPEGPPVFGVGLPEALDILYRHHVQVFKYNEFPLWLDNLDQTYFFQVDHRRVAERADLVRLLQTRSRCSNASSPAVTWEFASDAQGWEAWNQLDDLTVAQGVLAGHATGSDAYLGSPGIDLTALTVGDIEITMRVRAAQPTFKGTVYWLTTDQQDFSPGLQESFTGYADNEFHVYRVDLARRGMFMLDDRIVRLRLDPLDEPGELALKSVRIYSHCDGASTEGCTCPP